MKSNVYVAYGEEPILVCAYGKTPGKAMKDLGKLIDKYIKQNEDYLVLGMNSSYDEDGVFCMNATISAWR